MRLRYDFYNNYIQNIIFTVCNRILLYLIFKDKRIVLVYTNTILITPIDRPPK